MVTRGEWAAIERRAGKNTCNRSLGEGRRSGKRSKRNLGENGFETDVRGKLISRAQRGYGGERLALRKRTVLRGKGRNKRKKNIMPSIFKKGIEGYAKGIPLLFEKKKRKGGLEKKP